MENIYLKTIFLIALTLTGILCGASLDQSIKQLPARHRIGVVTFSGYAKAADLKNGVLWYAIIGIGSAITSIITAIIVLTHFHTEIYSLPIYLAGLFALCHSVCTGLAAPTYHKQKIITDHEALIKLFNRFEFIQTFRSIFIVLNFLSFVWALFIIL